MYEDFSHKCLTVKFFYGNINVSTGNKIVENKLKIGDRCFMIKLKMIRQLIGFGIEFIEKEFSSIDEVKSFVFDGNWIIVE